MRRTIVSGVTMALIAAASLVQAQAANNSPEAVAAFSAIIWTPAGALPQIVRAQRTFNSGARGDVALQYGRYKLNALADEIKNIGLTGGVRVTRRFRLGATIGRESCSSCDGLTMGGVDLSASLFHKGASADVGGDTDVGLLVRAGMGKADTSDVTARSLVLSLPLAVSLEQVENSVLTLYLSPSAAYGSLADNGVTLGGWRPMIGAGLGYQFGFGLGVHAAAHKVILDDSPTHFGLAVSWQFGGKH